MDSDLDLSSHRQMWQSLMVKYPEGPSLVSVTALGFFTFMHVLCSVSALGSPIVTLTCSLFCVSFGFTICHTDLFFVLCQLWVHQLSH